MHARDDPRSQTADAGIVALAPDGAHRSELLGDALAAGSTLASTLEGLVATRLDPDAKQRLDARVAQAAAYGAYAGMALWTLNAMTAKHEGAGRLAEAVAGLGMGVLAAHG